MVCVLYVDVSKFLLHVLKKKQNKLNKTYCVAIADFDYEPTSKSVHITNTQKQRMTILFINKFIPHLES